MPSRSNDASRPPRREGPPGSGRPDEIALAPEVCRRRREALGLSISELARRAGLTEQTVERFEDAAVRPRAVTIVALRNALRRSELNLAIPRLQPLVPSAAEDA